MAEDNQEIEEIAEDLSEYSIDEAQDVHKVLDANDELIERIRQLEVQNEELRVQIENHIDQLSLFRREADLDPKILEFLEEHQDLLTLDFLKKAYQTLVDLKALNPEINFNDYMDELKNVHLNYLAKLNELTVAKKETELKLKIMKQRHEEELTTLNETRVEQIFKNSGAKEHLMALKEKNSVQNETINSLKSELETKRSEASLWKDKCKEAEKQFGFYWQAWKDTQMKLAQLEAEQRTNPDRSGMINLSSASSFADHQVPPPPPVEAPSREELFKAQPSASLFSSGASNIPPPPPLAEPPIGSSTSSSGLRFR